MKTCLRILGLLVCGALIFSSALACNNTRAIQDQGNVKRLAVMEDNTYVSAIETETGTLYMLHGYNRCAITHVPKAK